MWQISLSQKIIFQICFITLTAVAGFRTVVLKSKDGGEERNEEEEQGDEDGVLLSEVIQGVIQGVIRDIGCDCLGRTE